MKLFAMIRKYLWLRRIGYSRLKAWDKARWHYGH